MPTCVEYMLGFLVLLVAGSVWIHVRTRRIAASRPGENFDTFRSSFRPDEAPEDLLRIVYATFQQSSVVAAFPVRADDDIGDIYGMVDDDLDDTILEVVAGSGRVLPPVEQLRRMRPVVTVRDLVSFITACPTMGDRSGTATPPGCLPAPRLP